VARTYLLVHPEKFPALDGGSSLTEDEDLLARLPWTTIEDRYGAEVLAAASQCDRKVVVLDGTAMDDIDEYFPTGRTFFWDQDLQDQLVADDCAEFGDLTVGVPALGWTIILAEPHELCAAVRRAFRGYDGEVMVAGYARRDCVARAMRSLTRLGVRASLHEAGTLPLTLAAAQVYLREGPSHHRRAAHDRPAIGAGGLSG
jgi:hypothetical protein